MNSATIKIVAAGAFSLAIGMQPAIASAGDGLALEPTAPAIRTETTAPFDPICPLCFIREFIESGS